MGTSDEENDVKKKSKKIKKHFDQVIISDSGIGSIENETIENEKSKKKKKHKENKSSNKDVESNFVNKIEVELKGKDQEQSKKRKKKRKNENDESSKKSDLCCDSSDNTLNKKREKEKLDSS